MEKMIMEMILRIKDRLFEYEKIVLILGQINENQVALKVHNFVMF